MIKAFGKYWQNFAEFSLRTRRRDFWLATLCNLIINGLLMGLYVALPVFKYVMVGYSIVCLCPGLAMAVRRLHDTGKSGKFLFMLLIPIVGWIIVFVKLVSDSQKEDNKYGASEKYSPQPEQAAPTESVEQPPMYIPPIYNTDKPDQAAPTDKENKAEATAAEERKEEAFAALVQDTVADTAAQTQPVAEEILPQAEESEIASQNTDSTAVQDTDTDTQPGLSPAIEEIIAQYISPVDKNKNNEEISSETAAEVEAASSIPAVTENTAAQQAPLNQASVTEDIPSRPSYSADRTAESTDNDTVVQKTKPARPKGYRSRTFPYGH